MILLKKYFIVILLLNTKTFVVNSQQRDFKYVQTYRDKRSTLYTYLKLTDIDELKCISACSNDLECGSINHHNELQLCELNESREESDQHTGLLKVDKGWNHFIKDKVLNYHFTLIASN